MKSHTRHRRRPERSEFEIVILRHVASTVGFLVPEPQIPSSHNQLKSHRQRVIWNFAEDFAVSLSGCRKYVHLVPVHDGPEQSSFKDRLWQPNLTLRDVKPEHRRASHLILIDSQGAALLFRHARRNARRSGRLREASRVVTRLSPGADRSAQIKITRHRLNPGVRDSVLFLLTKDRQRSRSSRRVLSASAGAAFRNSRNQAFLCSSSPVATC
jgi:hypothetical protein